MMPQKDRLGYLFYWYLKKWIYSSSKFQRKQNLHWSHLLPDSQLFLRLIVNILIDLFCNRDGFSGAAVNTNKLH
jgi:hypothetical protein